MERLTRTAVLSIYKILGHSCVHFFLCQKIVLNLIPHFDASNQVLPTGVTECCTMGTMTDRLLWMVRMADRHELDGDEDDNHNLESGLSSM